MSQENVEIVAAFFEAATSNEHEAYLADDVEFVPFTRLAGRSRGPEGFTRQIAEIADQFAEYEVRAEQLRPVGDRVVAALQRRARSTRSPVPLTDRFAQVFTLLDREIVRIQSYPSFSEALEAAGLRSSAILPGRCRTETQRSSQGFAGVMRRSTAATSTRRSKWCTPTSSSSRSALNRP